MQGGSAGKATQRTFWIHQLRRGLQLPQWLREGSSIIHFPVLRNTVALRSRYYALWCKSPRFIVLVFHHKSRIHPPFFFFSSSRKLRENAVRERKSRLGFIVDGVISRLWLES
ncbi:hypothetical protein Droror1_Dr00012602 [Drosera rotundifolia]